MKEPVRDTVEAVKTEEKEKAADQVGHATQPARLQRQRLLLDEMMALLAWKA